MVQHHAVPSSVCLRYSKSGSSTFLQLLTLQIQSALICAVVASSFTWPAVSDLPYSMQSTVLAIWYNSLLMSLVTIACATQQAVALSRLYSHVDRVHKIRNFLGSLENHAWKPRKLQLYIWQVPATLLNASIYSFMIGTSVLVYGSASVLWSVHDIKVSTVFSIFNFGLYSHP